MKPGGFVFVCFCFVFPVDTALKVNSTHEQSSFAHPCNSILVFLDHGVAMYSFAMFFKSFMSKQLQAAAILSGNEVAIVYWGSIPSHRWLLLASSQFGYD